MAYPEDHLHAHESVVLDLRPHWWFFVRQIVALLAAIIIGVLVLAFTNTTYLSLVAGVLILVAIAWFGLRYMRWTTTAFVVTTDRLITRTGVLSRKGVEIPLERVNTVFFSQSFFERMIGSGDLEIESASEDGSSVFNNIRKPIDVQNEIYRQMENNENRKFDRVSANLAGATGASPDSIPDQIAKLDELRQKGILSNEEFQAKKAELLGRM